MVTGVFLFFLHCGMTRRKSTRSKTGRSSGWLDWPGESVGCEDCASRERTECAPSRGLLDVLGGEMVCVSLWSIFLREKETKKEINKNERNSLCRAKTDESHITPIQHGHAQDAFTVASNSENDEPKLVVHPVSAFQSVARALCTNTPKVPGIAPLGNHCHAIGG